LFAAEWFINCLGYYFAFVIRALFIENFDEESGVAAVGHPPNDFDYAFL